MKNNTSNDLEDIEAFVPTFELCDNDKARDAFKNSSYVWIKHHYDDGDTIELAPRMMLCWRSDVQPDDDEGNYVRCPNVAPAPLAEEIIDKCRELNMKNIIVSDRGWKIEGEMKSVSLSDRNMATALLMYWNMMMNR